MVYILFSTSAASRILAWMGVKEKGHFTEIVDCFNFSITTCCSITSIVFFYFSFKKNENTENKKKSSTIINSNSLMDLYEEVEIILALTLDDKTSPID